MDTVNASNGRSGVDIALISLPWHLANRPCAALGVLKGYLSEHGRAVDAYHFHLSIASQLTLGCYHRIAMDWPLAEALYAALVAPEEQQQIIRRALRRLADMGQADASHWLTSEFCRELAKITEETIGKVDWSRYQIVGFSVSHPQLMAALYVARLLKRDRPSLVVVFGGSVLSGEVGRNLMARCQEVDLVVDGEGEQALDELAQLSLPLDERQLGHVPNIWFRTRRGEIQSTARQVLCDLGDLPYPDYTEYFDLARQLEYPASDLVLPIEGSRGCSWECRDPRGTRRGCAFCGLNRSWPNYRQKPLPRVVAEIEQGAAKYHVLNLSFVDAMLPESFRRELLSALIASERDYTLFCEMRPGFDEETAELLARAGTRRIQIGIESFSTAMLRRLGKGVRAIDNVDTLRLCLEYGLPHQWNLLVDVPGATAQELEETLAILPSLYGLQPPNLVPFFLSRGSRVYESPAEFDVISESLDEEGCEYLPSSLAKARITTQVSFRRAGPIQEEAWQKIAAQVTCWRQTWQRTSAAPGRDSPLSYCDGGNFVLITDLRAPEPVWITLEGNARAVFLGCRRAVSLSTLHRQLPDIPPVEVDLTVDQLVSQALALREGNRAVALPIHSVGPCGVPRSMLRC